MGRKPEMDMYYIDDKGRISLCTQDDLGEREVDYNWYLNYKTARDESLYLRAYRKLRNLARAFNGDWKPSFDKNGSCSIHALAYSIHFLAGESVEIVSRYSYTAFGEVLFKSEELAKMAVDQLTIDEIKLLGSGRTIYDDN